MRMLIAVLALVVMIPVAQADDETTESGQDTGPTGGICIQTIEGPTVCK